MANAIYTHKAPEPIGPYSQAIETNGTLYVSGQIGYNNFDEAIMQDSMEEETEQVMLNLEYILKQAGCSFEDVVKCSIFLTDMGSFEQVNEVYASKFWKNKPARETVEVSALPKGARVEISCIAIVPASEG